MFKNPWTGLIISLTVKVGAFLLIRKALANSLADLIERRPDLAEMYTPK